MRYSGKTVFVLPGSAWQVPLVKRLKSDGCRVLVVNPYRDSPAFLYADDHLQVDIFSEDDVYKYCVSNHVDAVLSDECDIAMPVVARLANRLGLPGISQEAARLFTDKSLMRTFCAENGFPSPESLLCTKEEDALEFAESIGFPIVVKPLDSNSSRGVKIVKTLDEVVGAFREASRFSRAGTGALVERFVSGIEFTVDGIKTSEGHKSLAVSRKKHFSHNASIASELYFSDSDSEYDYCALKELNDALINATPLEFGLTHVEYKYENGRFYLIEMAARGGGNLISSHIVPFISGVDNYGSLIDYGINGSTTLSVGEISSARCALLEFLPCPSSAGTGGVVKAIEGTDVFSENPEVAVWNLNFNVGDEIKDAENDASRLGFYIALCETEDRLQTLRSLVHQHLRIIV